MSSYFIFQSDMLCEDCGNQVRDELTAAGKAPDSIDHESRYDSNDFPKGPYKSHFDESDSPRHCGMGERCINAEECPTHGGHKIGLFLENHLTSDGRQYVENACRKALAGNGGCVALEVWAPFYRISLEDDDAIEAGE